MSKYSVKTVLSTEAQTVFQDLYADWAATIEGLNPNDESQLMDFIDKQGGLKDTAELVHYTGKDMNDVFKLTGDNAYPADLNMYSVRCGDIKSVNKLALPMRQIGMRWFTDIVDNNARREDNADYVESIM